MKVSRKCAAMVLALPIALIALQMIGHTKTTLTELSTENNISRPHHQHNEEKYAPLISRFDQQTMNNTYDTYNSPKEDWKKRKKKQDDNNETELHYHDYAIFIVMYHKTGFVLSRQLKMVVSMLETEANRPNESELFNANQHTNYGTDKITGERFAFDTIGGWTRSAFAPRRHSFQTHCPRGYRHEPFLLKSGQIYMQESPDLFCDVKQLEKAILARRAKIIHFVRNPYDMVLSNYLYHSQEPTPEKWVHEDDPCMTWYESKETLASNVLPSIGTEEVNDKYFYNIFKMCRSLFQSKSSMWNSTFYEHLLELDPGEGLRLATAQMVAASGYANRHKAGGDIARMANNIVKLKELQSYMPSEVEVLTLSTEEFITTTANSTMKFLDFVFGANNTIISRKKRWEAARLREKQFEKKSGKRRDSEIGSNMSPRKNAREEKRKQSLKKKASHFTQSITQEEKETKESLKKLLHSDKDLAPILKLTESLVNEALSASAKVV